MTVRWVEDRPVRWLGEDSGRLGLFSEPTTAECQTNLYNQDACYAICASTGIGGWGGLFIWPCVNQCMVEGCGSGILVSHTQMQKVGAAISPCFNACMDAFQQEELGTDEAALRAAAQQCAQKCGIAQVTKSTPGGTKVKKTGGGGTAPSPGGSAPTTTASAGGGGGSGLLVAGLVVAALVGIAVATGSVGRLPAGRPS